jgi:hypothetical protein
VTLVTRLLVSLLCIAGCSRSADSSDRPRQGDQKRVERGSLPSAAGGSSRSSSDQKSSSSNRLSSTPFPPCAEGWDLQATPEERLANAAEHCGAGLKAKGNSMDWRLGSNQPAELARLPAGEAKCVRAVVVIREAGYSAHVSLVDTLGRVLASASGTSLIIVPENGPLCIPNEVALVARVSADNAALSGVAVILESQ